MEEKFSDLSPLALAFMGDAVHTAYIRKVILEEPKQKLNEYNNKAKKFCNASYQAKALEKISNILKEDEEEIVRRARNTKPKHSAKNFDEKTYNKATSFEALVGYLYLNKNYERLEEILKLSMQIDT